MRNLFNTQNWRQRCWQQEDAELIEDSPSEPYWGVGPDGQGLNWAGRVLMEVRQKLADDRENLL